ncbi:PIG-L family deacetylase [Streptodolium elevatio]|uniref:PIG-L family deacetylase n=1 Tax=Streptodolium elevatio TaxID=3157996 RepID=A0ABV3DW55_9ACTN
MPAGIWVSTRGEEDSTNPQNSTAPPDKTAATHLHIVAHPDDDLYFLNPDIQQAIRSGEQLIGVCVTCGETDGRNNRAGDDGATVPVDFPGYSAARQTGLRAAYAEMAVGDRKSPWTREALPMPGGPIAELATLTAAPHVRLVFLNLWQDGTRSGTAGAGRPRELWEGKTAAIPTMAFRAGPATRPYTYSRETLIEGLAALIERFKPTVIRTLDPDPDHLKHDDRNPATRQHADFEDFADHQDHTAVALFSWAAVQTVNGRGGGGAAVESYRGYVNERWPYNLDGTAFREKVRLLDVYGWADGADCGAPEGCGDLKVAAGAPGTGWAQSTTHRYPGNASWLCAAPDGRLAAFAVFGGEAVMWAADRDGRFAAPVPLGGGPLLPHLAVTCTRDGRFHVFGVRMTLGRAPVEQRRALVVAAQTAPGGPFAPWAELGNPADGTDVQPGRARGIGMPAAVAVDSGVHVFVRNTGTGLSGRRLDPGGQWGPWTDHKGSGIQDGLAVVTTADNRIEVFGSSADGIVRWYQPDSGGPFRVGKLHVAAPAGPPIAIRGDDGRLRLIVRQPQSAWVLLYTQLEPRGGWDLQPQWLGGDGGFGPVAAVAAEGGRTGLACRNGRGNVSVGWHDLQHDAAVDWMSGGPVLLHSPAVARDGGGRLVAAVVGVDGRLHVARSDADSGRMSSWTAVV